MAKFKLLWRQSTSLIVVLAFSILINANETPTNSVSFPAKDVHLPKSSMTGPSHLPQRPSDGESETNHGNSLLTSRKMSDAQDKQGLLAGPMFLGLASLLFPVLPVLLLAPLAVAGAGPAMNYLQDVFGTQGNNNNQGQGQGNQALNNFLQTLGSSNNNNDQATSGSSVAQTISNLVGNPNGASQTGSSLSQMLSGIGSSNNPGSSSGGMATSGSSLSQMVQALGLGNNADSEPEPQEGQGSGSLFSGSSSLLNSIFGPDRASPSSSSGIFSGSGSIFGNLASGSRPVPAYASPNGNKVGHSQGNHNANGQTIGTSDILGAAAAALDNAGLLGPIAGAGSGSMASQLMNLVKPSSGQGQGSSGGLFSSGLSELLGLGESTKASQPTQGQQPALGSSLSSNIVQGLTPHTYGQAQMINQLAGQMAANNQNAQSSSGLSNLFSGSDKGSSLTKLTNNALNSLTNFIFSKKRSEFILRPYPEFGYVENAASKAKLGLSGYLKDVFSTFKDGVRRYEIGESECQARLICEMNQKAVGRSFKSWANTVLDLLGVESMLDKTTFHARTKNVMKDLYRAARTGMNDKDCAVMYSRCPVNIAVEPMRNSVLNKIMSMGSGNNGQGHNGQAGHHGQQQINHGNKHAAVYGPNVNNQAGAQSSAQNGFNGHQQQAATIQRNHGHGQQQPSLTQKMSASIQRANNGNNSSQQIKQTSSPSNVNQVAPAVPKVTASVSKN